MRLTPSKQAILDFVRRFFDKHKYSPSYQEIAEEMGYYSLSTVHKHIHGLIEGGYLATCGDKESLNYHRALVPLPPEKEHWEACDVAHPVVLYKSPACPVCREKQATLLTMEKVNGR